MRLASRLLLGEPHLLIFFVTGRCNLACRHCLLHDLTPAATDPPAKELTIEEIDRLAGSVPPLGELALTGGEPFLRDDLPEIALSFIEKKKARRLNVITNGWEVDRVEKFAAAILRSPLKRLDMQVSLDGPPDVHDEIHGREGAYVRATETIKRIVDRRKRASRLTLGIIATYQKENRSSLRAHLNDLRALAPDSISLNLLRGKDADWSGDRESLADYAEVYREYQRANASAFRRAYKSMVLEMQLGLRRAPCMAGTSMAVLRETGVLYACEPRRAKMADLREFQFDFRRAWRSAAAREAREFAMEQCRQCSYECVLPFNLAADWRQLATLASRTLSEKLLPRSRAVK